MARKSRRLPAATRTHDARRLERALDDAYVLRRIRAELDAIYGLDGDLARRGDERARGHIEIARHLQTVIANLRALRRAPGGRGRRMV